MSSQGPPPVGGGIEAVARCKGGKAWQKGNVGEHLNEATINRLRSIPE
jgi:hypothetical protein